MAKYRQALPQMSGKKFLTDGGMETTFIFNDGIDLPCFASFDLMKSESGRAHMRAYYTRYAKIALAHGTGFVLEAPTWRASADWGRKIGYTEQELARANRDSIAFLVDIRSELETPRSPMPISGNLGPRGDGYDPGALMNIDEARDYHASQIETFRSTQADFVSAFTMNNVPEAVGIALAAQEAGIPSVISFTVETDGRLPTGDALPDAIEAVDNACATAPVYYMINCAHPSHFEHVLAEGGAWVHRIRGLRSNSSRCSHAELDNATELDAGDPEELGSEHRALMERHGQIAVLGGCCGTDHRHVQAIARACMPASAAAA